MIVTVAKSIGDDFGHYFPSSSASPVLEFESYTITLISQQIHSGYLIIRQLRVQNSETGFDKVFSHYHFKGWPDFSTPKDKSQESLNYLVTLAIDFVNQNNLKSGQER